MMMMRLFIPLIMKGIISLVLSETRKYYLILQNETWLDAQTYCRLNHVDLVTIRTADDVTQLQKLQYNSRAWTGLYRDVNNWLWSYGNETLGSFRPWVTGKPSNGNEECAAIGSQGWTNINCANTGSSICYDEKLNKYIYISVTKKWTDAQANCRKYYTDLASARDLMENTLVKGLIVQVTWFGLFRSSWRWSDQSNLSVMNWKPGQPDYTLLNGYCGSLMNAQVQNTPCSTRNPFYCYGVITGQQRIVRMKVQSDQDVNNPAVNAVIMEKISQKLNELGVTNVSVKFREQHNGTVFHNVKQITSV